MFLCPCEKGMIVALSSDEKEASSCLSVDELILLMNSSEVLISRNLEIYNIEEEVYLIDKLFGIVYLLDESFYDSFYFFGMGFFDLIIDNEEEFSNFLDKKTKVV